MEGGNHRPAFSLDTNLSAITPLDLALEHAKRLESRGELENLDQDAGIATVQHLDDLSLALEHDFQGKRYRVQTERAVLLPENLRGGIDIEVVDFPKVEFLADFTEYGTLRINYPLEEFAIRALSMRFKAIVFLPDRDELLTGMMHVPVRHDCRMEEIAA